MKEGDTSKAKGISLINESQAIEEDFINTYRKLPELWDTDNPHYTNKYKRNAALDVLLPIVKRWNPSATRYNVRQKINITRSCYRKDLKKYLASKRIGPNGEEIFDHEPKSWKFHALRFLDQDKPDNNEIVEVNLEGSNFEEEEASDGSTSELDAHSSQASDVFASIVEPEPYRPRHQNKRINKRVKLEMDNEYYEREERDMLDREFEAIGANVKCKLKRMDPLQRYHAELLINKVLITGLKKNLTDDTDLTEVYKT